MLRPRRRGLVGLRPLAQRPELESTEKNLGQFGLQLNAPERGIGIEGLVHENSVDIRLNVSPFANHVEAVPLAVGAVDVLLSPKSEFVFPVGVAAVPVDAFAVIEVKRLATSSALPDHFAVAVAIDFARQRQGNGL